MGSHGSSHMSENSELEWEFERAHIPYYYVQLHNYYVSTCNHHLFAHVCLASSYFQTIMYYYAGIHNYYVAA